MGTMNTIYAIGITDSRFDNVVMHICGKITQKINNNIWTSYEIENHDLPDEKLKYLSIKLGNVIIYAGFQSTVDAFYYIKYDNGIFKRKLVYGCFKLERQWEVVVGDPEPWENKIFKICPVVKDDQGIIDSRETMRQIANMFDWPGWN
jgi:hypothetical protein